jgi:hypothetical protein
MQKNNRDRKMIVAGPEPFSLEKMRRKIRGKKVANGMTVEERMKGED